LKLLVDADAWQILGQNETNILYFLPPASLFKKRFRVNEVKQISYKEIHQVLLKQVYKILMDTYFYILFANLLFLSSAFHAKRIMQNSVFNLLSQI